TNSQPKLGVKEYEDADKQKSEILEENRGKTGIYMWINKINGKRYVGSAKDLKRRLQDYYNYGHLSVYKTHITKALLKYGYSAFSLHILEMCEVKDLISREQHYFDLLQPEYNICKQAGSTLGRLHTESSK